MKTFKRLFLLIIFISPFFQGLYFYFEVFFVAIIMLLMLIVVGLRNKELVLLKGINTFIIAAIVCLYFITSIYAIDSGMALMGSLKMLSVLIFYMLYAQIYSDRLKEATLQTVAYSCVTISTLSIVAYTTGYFYDHLVQNDRLGGSFQYANTFGLFCLLSIIILIRKNTKRIWDYIGIIIITISLLLTFSRSIIALAAVVVMAIVIIEKENRKMVMTILGIVGVIFGVLIYQNDLMDMALRLKEAFSAGEWQIRLLYYEDALEMIRAYPFGMGHLGYYYAQRFFQTGSTYYIKYVHSSLYQMTLDISIIGGVLFAVFFALNIFKKGLDRYCKLMLMVILVHSLVDFDFEFSYIWFLVILIVGFNRTDTLYLSKKRVSQTIILSGLGIMYTYMFVATFMFYNHQYKGAYKLYPLYTEAKIKAVNNSPRYAYKDFVLCEEILGQNDYLVEAFAYMRDYYYNKSDFDNAIKFAEKTMAVNPLAISHVEIYSDILIDYAETMISKGMYEEALVALDTIINLQSYLSELAKKTNTDYNVIHKPILIMTKTLRDNYGEAYELKIYIEGILDT